MQRNRGKHGYGYKQAHTKAIEQRKGKVNPRIDGGTWVFIETLIRKDWSSEHIHSWMKENMGVTVSHEWIYQYILQDKQTGGDLYTHLRCRKKRSRVGDWEADTIIGKGHKQALVSLTERKFRLPLIYKVERETKEEVTDAVTTLLNPIKDHVLTLTSDNGKEFAGHETIAHPYSSYERGTNENTNGLIRQYFPKSSDCRTITDDEIIGAMKRLNNRPRKCPGFKTPNQVFFHE